MSKISIAITRFLCTIFFVDNEYYALYRPYYESQGFLARYSGYPRDVSLWPFDFNRPDSAVFSGSRTYFIKDENLYLYNYNFEVSVFCYTILRLEN